MNIGNHRLRHRLHAPLQAATYLGIAMIGLVWAGAYWHEQAAYYGAAVALTAAVLAVVTMSVRHRLRLDASRDSLRAAEARAVAKSRELEVALDHMSQGIMMVDAEQHIAVINRQALKLLGLPEGFLHGRRKFDDLLAHQSASGEFGQDGEVLAPGVRDLVKSGGISGTTHVYERTRANGVVLEIRSMPLADGGMVRTFTDISERKRDETRTAHMARHDALTNLANRALLRERMEHALARLQRFGEGFAVFCLDLDGFHGVNDALGQPEADELLRGVAQRLCGCVRETDTVARLGGDEFAILQAATQQHEGTRALAERVLYALDKPFDLGGSEVVVGAHMGIALAPRDGVDADQLLRNADLALRHARSEGRKAYRVFEAEMDAFAQARRELETALRNSLLHGQFELHYQPLVNLETNEIKSLEALLRWRHPGRGIVAPADFIPLAEDIGLILPLGEWVLRQACADAVRWPGDVKVAVNLSPAQFKKGNLTQVVMSALASSGLAPARLELEITETVLLQESAGNLRTLHQLRALGVGIALDDFGTGYSSLSYLHTFPFSKIKIDKCFIGELSKRADSAGIVRAVAGLGRSLGMTTTAEGVEAAEQLDELRAAGCTEAQGFLLGRPRPAAEIAEELAARVKDAEKAA